MKWLFVALLLSLPIGARKGLFNAGMPATEWNLVFVSFSTLLAILAIAIAVLCGRRQISSWRLTETYERYLALFVGLVAFAGFLHFGSLTLFRLALLFIFVGSAFLVRYGISRYGIKLAYTAFVGSAVIQALISIAQFFRQHDLGLKLLGESPIASGVAGVARFAVGRTLVIRAYGTLPHPNILAAYLTVALWLTALLALGLVRKGMPLFWKLFLIGAAIFVLMFGLLVTFSRTAIIASAIFGIAAFIWSLLGREFSRGVRETVLGLGIAATVAFVIFGTSLLPFWTGRAAQGVLLSDTAVSSRFWYAGAALRMIRANPIFGVGWGSFSDELPNYVVPKPVAVPSVSFPLWMLQPVHNIYLLIAAEAGLIALAAFLLFVFYLMHSVYKRRTVENIFLLAGFGSLLTLGFFDHFLLTTVSGGFLFWFFAGILMAVSQRKE